MKRAIVFGGGGFLGSAVVEALQRHGVETCAVVKPGFWNSPEQFRLMDIDIPVVECDLRELATLRGRLPWRCADVFYQLAWDGITGEAMQDYALQLENVKWTLDSLRIADELQCSKFIGAGTISQDELLTPEGRAYTKDRHRFYRVAAQACEDMGRAVMAFSVQFIWPIVSNVYGEGELNPRFITSFLRALLHGESMPLSSGMQLYDFLYRSDAGEAYALLGEYGMPFRRYNIASSEGLCLRDYVEKMTAIVAPDIQPRFGERSDSGVVLTETSFDKRVLSEDTGFYPLVPFEKGIRRTVAWMRERME